LWGRLRDLLDARSIDPRTTVLALTVEDGEAHEFGVVVTPDRRVFTYALDENGVGFDEWAEITHDYSGTPYGQDIEAALTQIDTAARDVASSS
jgi:hypothetical protein